MVYYDFRAFFDEFLKNNGKMTANRLIVINELVSSNVIEHMGRGRTTNY